MPTIRPLGGHELLILIVQFGLLLLFARTLGELAKRFRLPSVVGELLAGVVLGPSLLGAVAPGVFHTLFPAKAEPVHLLEALRWLGVILLLNLTVGRRLVAALIRTVDNRIGGDMAKVTTLILLALALGALTQFLGLEAVLGAFIAGVLVGRVRRFDHHVAETFKNVALSIFAP